METVSRLIRPFEHVAPFRRLHELCGDAPWLGLLDSALEDDRLGRWSILVPGPERVLTAKRAPGGGAMVALVDGNDAPLAPPRHVADPFDELRSQLDAGRPAPGPIEVPPDAPDLPFLGGALLCLGYEAGHLLEDLPDTGEDRPRLPDLVAMFCDEVLLHDHETGRSWISVIGRGPTEREARRRAEARIDSRRRRLSHARPPVIPAAPRSAEADWTPASHDRPAYLAAVERIKADIHAGRVFEACLCQRLEMPLRAAAETVYRELRRLNPAPFAAFLRLPDAAVACSSPERFLRCDRDGLLESRPIKGTRPRGRTPAEDAALRADLVASEKDRAENLMIVDLVRNDLGRVCDFGSVEAPEICAIEGYATVWQMVSTITGRLRAGLTALDALRAAFPGGSMTGAPKIEAMRVIDELEPLCRGIYSGSLGYLDWRGNLDLNIVIRTAVLCDGKASFGVGGAVVADSDPAAEYQESLDKARALIEAVAAANIGSGG